MEQWPQKTLSGSFSSFSGWTVFLFHGDKEMQGVLTSPLPRVFFRIETGPNWNVFMDCGVNMAYFWSCLNKACAPKSA